MRSPALLVLPLALLAAACGSSSSSSTSSGASSTPASTSSSTTASVSTRTISGLGTVLVNGQGRALYAFIPEKGGKVKCQGACASVWPPFTASSGQKPGASGGVNASMISTVANPSGGSVAAYNGWPLHTYAPDTGPGSAKGQGINSFGGLWYVISPSGATITKKASSSSSSTSSGGYGSSGY